MPEYNKEIGEALGADDILDTFENLAWDPLKGGAAALGYLEALVRNCPEKRMFLLTHYDKAIREYSTVFIKKVQDEENRSTLGKRKNP